jgi:uncharacterized protein (DUF2267 family)
MSLPASFQRTIQLSQEWLTDVMVELATDDRELAYAALRGVLHALRDRLPVQETLDLSAQLPMLVRGMYFEGWTLTDRSHSLRSRDAFLRHVADMMARPTLSAEDATRAVFSVLTKHVTRGEIDDIVLGLPEKFDDLWPV